VNEQNSIRKFGMRAEISTNAQKAILHMSFGDRRDAVSTAYEIKSRSRDEPRSPPPSADGRPDQINEEGDTDRQ
jgi:hypothetical protein